MILRADARQLPLADGCVQCVVTSPPYWGLRVYEGVKPSVWGGDPECEHEWDRGTLLRRENDGKPGGKQLTNPGSLGRDVSIEHATCIRCGAWLGCLGLEPTPEEYVANLVAVFREVRRVLRDDGTVWLNLGDSYANATDGNHPQRDTSGGFTGKDKGTRGHQGYSGASGTGRKQIPPSLKPKDLIGVPWRVAFALQADGWWLRSDIIWCLSGGTVVYARTQKGDMPMTVKDLARLDPSTVQLWNGKKWTQLLGMNRNGRSGTEIEIVLRSGERIGCTPTHRFPTGRGLVDAGNLRVGDVLQRCQLPEPDSVMDCAIDEDAAWLAGLYIAEGSMADDTIQIAGHVKEMARWDRVQRIAAKYGGNATKTECGNIQSIRLYGKVLCAILNELVSGKTAKDKCFGPHVWRYSNRFLDAMLDGYLSGDGHWHAESKRWRLGFTRNYNLERDLRVACARLGYCLTLRASSAIYNGTHVPTFRGEIRKERSGHWNEKDREEIVAIRRARCRQVYDLGVVDPPHLFALGSGVLTHNSKPNPMPESVTDRPTKAHEYLFLLTKAARYYYDAPAIAEQSITGDTRKPYGSDGAWALDGRNKWAEGKGQPRDNTDGSTRNRRSVWTIATHPFPGAHFATMPPALVEPCIKAGSRAGDVVLDPFSGAGTVGLVADRLGRRYVGLDISQEYNVMARDRIRADAPLFAEAGG